MLLQPSAAGQYSLLPGRNVSIVRNVMSVMLFSGSHNQLLSTPLQSYHVLCKSKNGLQHPSDFSSTLQWRIAGYSITVNTWLHIWKSSKWEIPYL